MSTATHKFQAPKGTRDFFPADLAVRRHLESVWRSISVIHGFEEVDGPTFEHLDLYTVKSGPGIVSELFSFRRTGGDTDYALRPEFTPTLARMVAARAAQLPRPIRWFSMPSMFRAERPQRGRLREHVQWNVDVVGDDSPRADADLVAVAAGVLDRLLLTPDDVGIRISDRRLMDAVLADLGVPPEGREPVITLLDRREKMPADDFSRAAADLGLDAAGGADLAGRLDEAVEVARAEGCPQAVARLLPAGGESVDRFLALMEMLDAEGLTPWVRFDPGIVRGLAYYSGTVFEVHETSGAERAVAGGGRYDHLVELFGGPPTPAAGFAMGDVVIALILRDRGLLDSPESYLPRPDVFVVAGTDAGAARVRSLVAELRRAGVHARASQKTTRNVGKLLGEAARHRARRAVILGAELDVERAVVKDLDSGEQTEVALTDLLALVREAS